MEEILHQLIWRISHDLQGFYTFKTVVGNGMSQPSTLAGRLTGYFWSHFCRQELKAGDGYSKSAAEGFIDAYEGRSLDPSDVVEVCFFPLFFGVFVGGGKGKGRNDF